MKDLNTLNLIQSSQIVDDVYCILQDYVEILKDIYKEALVKVILFGSYARGDYNEDSDIDIMVLLDVPPKKERKRIKELIGMTFDFNLDNNVDIQPIPKSIYTFRKWKNVLPFYMSVKNEGVVLYRNSNQ